MRSLSTSVPVPFRVPPGGSLRSVILAGLSMGFLVGCGCLYFYVFVRHRRKAGAEPNGLAVPPETLRLVESLRVTPLADVRLGALVAVSGKVVGGRRVPPAGKSEPTESPWIPSPPAEVHRYLLLDDSSGATLQVGRREVGTFCIGDQVFAVGKVEGQSVDDPYRSAASEPVLLPGDGLFVVVRGTKIEALDQLRERPTGDSRAQLMILMLGVVLVVGCVLGTFVL